MASADVVGFTGCIPGALALLSERDELLRFEALNLMNQKVDDHWHEIADAVTIIEEIADVPGPLQSVASLLAAKIYFHLDEHSEALKFALNAGSAFFAMIKSQNLTTAQRKFVEIIVAKCVEEYIAQRRSAAESSIEESSPSQFERVVEALLDETVEIARQSADFEIAENYLKIALGVSLDALRLDKARQVMTALPNHLLSLAVYSLEHSQQLSESKKLRNSFYHLIVEVTSSIPISSLLQGSTPLGLTSETRELMSHFPALTEALVTVGDGDATANLLSQLIRNSSDVGPLMALQLAFEIVAMENVSFNSKLLGHEMLAEPNSQVPKDTDEATSDKLRSLTVHLRSILSGTASDILNLQFLSRANKTDLGLLDQFKSSLDPRNAITHLGLVLCHGLMQSGTTCDSFLRPNLDWLSKAVCWSKFSTTSSLGVLHKGHHARSIDVLATYLPGATSGSAGVYSEGGALFALGLIHAASPNLVAKAKLLESLESRGTEGGGLHEVLQHGASLGLGLMCMGTWDEGLCDELKSVLFQDSAVAGEAAVYGMGLVMLGSGNMDVVRDLLAYSRDTQHEKLVRGLAVAISLVMFKKEQEADGLFMEMAKDKDPSIRYGAAFVLGLAYCGTSANFAVQKLLELSVAEGPDDVRRAAVIALGFVLCNSPKQIPKLISLLTDSYNPHIRYGAAIALGFACAGSWDSSVVDLLLPLVQDTVEFVRQGALIALGLVCIQASPTALPDGQIGKIRESIQNIAMGKREDATTRFGALLAHGLIDAGGRNVTSSFFSSTGHLRPQAVVGFLLFAQFWFWYPLANSIVLTFQPTGVIGVTRDLKIPIDFQILSNAPPSIFASPPLASREKRETKKEIVTAVLSTTAKRRQIDKRKATKEVVPMDTSSPSAEEPGPVAEVEPSSEVLTNPCRVLPPQTKVIEFPHDGRYRPILTTRKFGFLVLWDSEPEKPQMILEDLPVMSAPAAAAELTTAPAVVVPEAEAEIPENFEWSG